MVWVLYPEPFHSGVHVPKKEEWIECQVTDQEYPQLLSKLVKRESGRTPGCSIMISTYISCMDPYETMNSNESIACGNGHFAKQSRQAVRGNESLTVKEVEYRPTENSAQRELHQRPRTMLQKADIPRHIRSEVQRPAPSRMDAESPPPHGGREQRRRRLSPDIAHPRANRRQARIFEKDVGFSLVLND